MISQDNVANEFKFKLVCWVSRSEFVSFMISDKVRDKFQTTFSTCIIPTLIAACIAMQEEAVTSSSWEFFQVACICLFGEVSGYSFQGIS